MTHPIAQTLARGHGRRHADCHLGLRTGSARGEWLSIAALLGDDERLRATLDRVGIEIGSSRRDVQASIFLEAYAWRLVLPLAGALVAEQRVAAPTLRDIALRPGEGRPSELLLRPGRFGALRNDRATAHPDATPARTPTALCEIFEATLIVHCEPIVVALNRRCGRSTRALWRTIGDRTATALLHAGLACKDRPAGEQLAHQILRGTPPLDVTPTYAHPHRRPVRSRSPPSRLLPVVAHHGRDLLRHLPARAPEGPRPCLIDAGLAPMKGHDQCLRTGLRSPCLLRRPGRERLSCGNTAAPATTGSATRSRHPRLRPPA